MVLLSTTFPYPTPEDRETVYNELTSAGIPTVFGMGTAAGALRKFVDYHQNQQA